MARSRHDASFTIVAPCCNESEAIHPFSQELVRVLTKLELDYTIVLVDDGSSDNTADLIGDIARHNPRVIPLFLSRNFGHQIALTAGFDAARDADAVIVMDSDLQHPPEVIEQLVQGWEAGGDVVMAVRQVSKSLSWFKRFTSSMFYWVFNVLSDTRIEPGVADFYLLSRPAHSAIRQFPERRRFLRGLIHWIGFERKYVEYVSPARVSGYSKYTVARMIAFATDGVLAFSSRPIRIATRLGIGIAGLGVVYLVYVLARAFLLRDLATGWGSLMAVLLVLGGVQLTFIGLIGEYIARIFEEAKSRPLYLLREEPNGHHAKPNPTQSANPT